MIFQEFYMHRSVSLALVACLSLVGCGTFPSIFPSAGPNRDQILNAADPQSAAPGAEMIQVVDLTGEMTRRVLASEKKKLFSETLGNKASMASHIGSGDSLEISVWEAPPATLFSTMALDPRAGVATSRVVGLPEQMVAQDGSISVPFAGTVSAAGKTSQQLAADIARRLQGKANQPQVLVRVTRNASANVTVVGEVAQSVRMPLTAKGERLLDAVAAAGGVRQPVGKMTLQLTRGDVVQAMALDSVIQDPKQNVFLQPGDVVTALFQPLSFTALGATGKNEEVLFEAQGISLAQALARSGGLQDQRADARGVFIFRFEEPGVTQVREEMSALMPDGRVPIVYRLDLKDPASFFLAQSFPMRNKDVIYISNAPVAELQKFMNLLTSVVFTATGLGSVGR